MQWLPEHTNHVRIEGTNCPCTLPDTQQTLAPIPALCKTPAQPYLHPEAFIGAAILPGEDANTILQAFSPLAVIPLPCSRRAMQMQSSQRAAIVLQRGNNSALPVQAERCPDLHAHPATITPASTFANTIPCTAQYHHTLAAEPWLPTPHNAHLNGATWQGSSAGSTLPTMHISTMQPYEHPCRQAPLPRVFDSSHTSSWCFASAHQCSSAEFPAHASCRSAIPHRIHCPAATHTCTEADRLVLCNTVYKQQ